MKLGCPVVEISRPEGRGRHGSRRGRYRGRKERQKPSPCTPSPARSSMRLPTSKRLLCTRCPKEQQRWYAIKVLSATTRCLRSCIIADDVKAHVEEDITAAEKELDDDAEHHHQRALHLHSTAYQGAATRRRTKGGLSTSDKIDKIVTNRWLGLPIFAVVMFLVYYLAMVTVGASATDWANDGLFGDGWHLFGIGSAAYNEVAEEWGDAATIVDGYDDVEEKRRARRRRVHLHR